MDLQLSNWLFWFTAICGGFVLLLCIAALVKHLSPGQTERAWKAGRLRPLLFVLAGLLLAICAWWLRGEFTQ